MASHKAQIPRQGLPDEGSAASSEVQATEEAGTESPRSNPMATTRKRKATATPDHSSVIAFALEAAMEVVNDQGLDELDWPVVLRSKVKDSNTLFSPRDLERYLKQAKLNRDGRKDFVYGKEALVVREDEWLWRGVVMRQATNMIFALPKVGKTRLILAMLAEFVKGRGEFAGVALHPGPEKLLILGPDQSESSWAGYLSRVGLASPSGTLSPDVIAMTTAETFFTLDEYWLTRIEQVLRERGPLVVLLDSYSAAIRATGLDENRSEAATPLMQLHNLVCQYKSTLIVIHHSNKAGGEGSAAKASRGSSAISACVDNLIEMNVHRQTEEDGVKKYELNVEGRAETDGVPLIGYSKHSNEWTSFGSLNDIRAEQRKDDNYDGLTQPQLMVLNALVDATAKENKSLSVGDIAELLNENPTKSQKVAVSKTVNRLVDLGFAVQKASAGGHSLYKQNQFMATGWAVSKHQIDF